MKICLQIYTTHQFAYFIYSVLFISRQLQECKNDVDPKITSKDTYKTIFILFI